MNAETNEKKVVKDERVNIKVTHCYCLVTTVM